MNAEGLTGCAWVVRNASGLNGSLWATMDTKGLTNHYCFQQFQSERYKYNQCSIPWVRVSPQ